MFFNNLTRSLIAYKKTSTLSNLRDPGDVNIRSLTAIIGEDTDQVVAHHEVVLGVEHQAILGVEHAIPGAERHVVLGVERHVVPEAGHLFVLLNTKSVAIHGVEHQSTTTNY